MATTSETIELISPVKGLLFHGMHAQEELSRPSEYQLDLLSLDKEVDRDKMLGAKVTIKVMMQDDKIRFFNGFVSRFSAPGEPYGKYTRYHAVVRPWLWFLTRTADCRIFQGKTVRQIVEDVFADHQDIADFTFELTESYRTWNYCVQYRETDFNFISRLLEHEGIYYYFRHTEGHHKLVLTDSVDKHDPFPGFEKLQYIEPGAAVRPGTEYISAWHISREVQPGVYVHDDYDYEKPGVDLTTTKALVRKYKPSNYEVYDFPGAYLQKAEGEASAHVRIDEFGAQFELAEAVTNYRGVTVGARFQLEGHALEKVNGKYVIVGATHTLESSQYEAGDGSSEFRCTFTALSTEQQFRPRRVTPKPFVQGPQTAVVVGPSGDEIYTDKYGRVKVQFHWDRRGEKNENSSCWVRVSHPWAGKGWGSVATPRIGQEVIVDFLEGDPDNPIITGRVYNEDNQPPFGFPAGAVISGIKSDTHKGSGYNEISCDDTAGKERVFIHGQYNMDTVVEHDQTTTVHNCRTDVIDVDDSETVGNNQTLHVVADQMLNIDKNRTETVGINDTVTIGSNRDTSIGKSETLTVTMQRTHTVGVNETITVGAAQEITVGGMQAISVGGAQTITAGGSQTLTSGASQSLNAGTNQAINVGGNQNVAVAKNATMTIGEDETRKVTGKRNVNVSKDDTLEVDKNLVIRAGDSVKIITGDASIVMKKDGTIQIKGKDITIDAGGKINIKASGDVVMKGSKIVQN